MSRLGAVVFDMDGLMFDTERLALRTWVAAGRQFGYKIHSRIVLSTVGMDDRDTAAVLKSKYGTDFPYDEIAARRQELGEDIIARNGVPVKEGLPELLAWFQGKHIPLGVATSTDRARAVRRVEQSGLTAFFQTVVGGDEVRRGKPEPDIYLLAARNLAVRPEEVLVLEDSSRGLQAAKAAGMTTVLIPDLHRPRDRALSHADVVCRSLREVQPIVEQWMHGRLAR